MFFVLLDKLFDYFSYYSFNWLKKQVIFCFKDTAILIPFLHYGPSNEI